MTPPEGREEGCDEGTGADATGDEGTGADATGDERTGADATGDTARFESLEQPRADRTREWELFVRESSAESLRHAGSVSAPTADIAREQATTLFGFAAETLWLCPADETVRLVAEDVALGDRSRGYETDREASGDGRADS